MPLTKITTNVLEDASVTSVKIADGAIATAKVADGAITAAKLASGAATPADGSITPAKLSQPLTLGTAQASTSGTTKDFTSIPSWVNQITVLFAGVSLSATANLLVQLGTSGGFETTGYASTSSYAGSTTDGSAANNTTGFLIRDGVAAGVISGALTLTRVTGNTWVASGALARTDAASVIVTAGAKTLGGTLTQVRITSTSTDTFDAGNINILYEG